MVGTVEGRAARDGCRVLPFTLTRASEKGKEEDKDKGGGEEQVAVAPQVKVFEEQQEYSAGAEVWDTQWELLGLTSKRLGSHNRLSRSMLHGKTSLFQLKEEKKVSTMVVLKMYRCTDTLRSHKEQI